MRIVLVSFQDENLGIEYISSLLKQDGHAVKLILAPLLLKNRKPSLLKNLLNRRKELLADIAGFRPDLIGFSIVTSSYLPALEMAEALKNMTGALTVFGGYHATVNSKEVLKNRCVDIVCRGEGELPMKELAESFNKKEENFNIMNLCFKKGTDVIINPLRPAVQDLDSLPFPDKSLYEDLPRLHTKYMISASRGCPYSCTYCGNSYLKKILGSNIRMRSSENVLDELLMAKRRWQPDKIFFVDDCIFSSRGWWEDFLEKFKRHIDLPYFCCIHADLMNPERVRILKETGCVSVEIGVQSINEGYRSRYLNRSGENKRIEQIVELCKKSRLTIQLDHIIGFPFETEKDMLEGALYYNRVRPDIVSAFIFTYYPGTALMEKAVRESWISEKEKISIERGELSEYTDYCGKDILKENRKRDSQKTLDFVFLYKLIQVLPSWTINLIIKTRIYRLFHHLPRTMIELCNLFVIIKKGHLKHYQYSYYLHMFLGIFIPSMNKYPRKNEDPDTPHTNPGSNISPQ